MAAGAHDQEVFELLQSGLSILNPPVRQQLIHQLRPAVA